MMYLGTYDEIHSIAEGLLNNLTEEEVIENVLNILQLAYIRGKKQAAADLNWSWDDLLLDGNWYEEVILKTIADKTVIERIKECYETKDISRLALVIDTEYHRDFNTGQQDMAEYVDERSVMRVKKVWHTQKDEFVRDTHQYLEGAEEYVGDRFFTFDNDSALEPGGFGLARNNCNCRCYLKYKR